MRAFATGDSSLVRQSTPLSFDVDVDERTVDDIGCSGEDLDEMNVELNNMQTRDQTDCSDQVEDEKLVVEMDERPVPVD